jgi:hypothetical protein
MDRSLDRDTWQNIIQSVRRHARAVKEAGRRPQYASRLIVAMYLWSVWHERCLSWACDHVHYNGLFRPRQLPSISQFTRRIKSDACQLILQRVHDDLARCGVAAGSLGYIDGKPLAVSPVSKDPDAARGHVTGGFAKGYKLHAYVNENRRIMVWSLTPLNTDEKTVAREALVPNLPPPADPLAALLLVDSAYDAAPLYKAVDARGDGLAMLAPVRGTQFVGPGGRHPRTLANMGPRRREALSLWENHADLVEYVMEQRNNIEGVFAVLALALGLHALPGFVRRLGRVRMWVGTKIILYHARLLAQEQTHARAAA